MKRSSKPSAVVDDSKFILPVCAALVVLIAIIYAQVGTHAFVNYDDDQYVSNNPHVMSGFTADSLRWSITAYSPNWHPAAWLTFLTDVTLFGLRPGPMLYANVLLHIASTLILFFFLKRTTMRLWPSAIVAALFAVHPLRVESVAWIAERKDVLCALFFFLAIWFYARWTESRDRGYYIAAVAMFAIGITAKGMIVTLPFVLILLDYWPLNRFDLKRNVIEKIPFFIVLVPGIYMTLWTQKKMATIAAAQYMSPALKASNAMLSYVAYIGKMFWPSHLAIPYPLRLVISRADVFLAALLLLAITVVVWMLRRQRRYLLVGWLWYLGMSVPVIGFVQIGSASMSDRYTYLPQIGLTFAIVWLLFDSIPLVAWTAPVAALTIVACIQTSYWKDSETLFRHSVAVSTNNRQALDHLGLALLEQKRYDEAAAEYRAALALNAQDEMALSGLGAIAALNPNDLSARAARAASEGKVDEAIALYRQIEPKTAVMHNDFAAMLARAGRDQEALAEYNEAVQLDPHQYDVRMNLGALLSRMNDANGAIAQFDAAAKEKPQSAEPHVYMALTYANAGRADAAIQEANAAMAIDHAGATRAMSAALQRPITIDDFVAQLRH